MTATVTDKMQVALPLEICAELGIEPGARLDFVVREGKIEATKVVPDAASDAGLASIYTRERNEEELAIQRGCSIEVPDDFPR
jgi:AbrB family looped-hinge helix DNA binding protein